MAVVNLIEISSLCFSYGSKSIVDQFGLIVSSGEIVALLAPSGAGKSTLFRLIAGLLCPDSGQVTYLGKQVREAPEKLFLGFQDFDAFPWLTVYENILMMQEFRPASDIAADASEITAIATRVGLEAEIGRYPRELSGGMRKRLAFARCLASGARLMLLDEPFSSLDIRSRREMQMLTLRLVRETGCGVIIATHDIQEAVLLADRIAICSGPALKIKAISDGGASNQRGAEYVESAEYQRRFSEVTHAFFTVNAS